MKPLNIALYGMGLLTAANSMPQGMQPQATAVSSQQTYLSETIPTPCICAEYIARRVPELGNVNGTGYSAEQDLINAGFTQTELPQPGSIAYLKPGIPNLTKANEGHIAIVEDVGIDGIPVITDSNSGGSDSSHGCSNVRTSKRKNYLQPGITFWVKS